MQQWNRGFFAGREWKTSCCHNSVSSSPRSPEPPSVTPFVPSLHKRRLMGISVSLLLILTWRSWVSESGFLPASEEDFPGITEREVYPWVSWIKKKILTWFSEIELNCFFVSGRKIQVYSPESLSDDSQCSPNLDADYIFPGPFASFLEEDLNGLSALEDIPSPSFSDYVPDLPNLSHNDIFDLPAEPLQIIEDSVQDEVEGSDIVDTSTTGGSFSSRSRQGDQERRRFSASELISRLQLSQRKNSFTLKLGKSLSARVASRDRQLSNTVGPSAECKYRTIPTLCRTFLSACHSVIYSHI